jgi:anaerobic selenocysteine-containing dehydrogenase
VTGGGELITFCRVCHACCGMRAEVASGRLVRVHGDPLNLVSRGFTWELVRNPGVLTAEREWCAQPRSLPPAWGRGARLVSRDLGWTVLGMPTAAAADEILTDDPQRIRALFVGGGNPVLSWPDQLRVIEALDQLELLVCIDVQPTETTRLADYVFAGTLAFEVPATTQFIESADAAAATDRIPKPSYEAGSVP